MVVRHLLHGVGVRDTGRLLGVAAHTVLRILTGAALEYGFSPRYRHYHKVQIDEQWSYAGNKKNKVWMFYAICGQTGEILAAVWGKRTKKTLHKLIDALAGLEIDFYCTDLWRPFTKAFDAGQHLRGKAYTKRIEGMNTWFRARISRLRRRTTTFSKKNENHILHLQLAICYRNNHASFI